MGHVYETIAFPRELFWEFATQAFQYLEDFFQHSSSPGHTASRLLIDFLQDTFKAVDALLDCDLVDTAIAIGRTSIDASTKCAFLLSHPVDEQDPLGAEFLFDLTNAYSTKISNKARDVVELARQYNKEYAVEIFTRMANGEGLTLSDLNSKSRKALEDKWSFAETSKHLEKKFEAEEVPHHFALSRVLYALGSHLLHADSAGIGIADQNRKLERTKRIAKETCDACSLLRSLALDLLLIFRAMQISKLIEESDAEIISSIAFSFSVSVEEYIEDYNRTVL